MPKTSNRVLLFAGEMPQYFPTLDYFYKMAQAGLFVLADDLHFSKQARVNRCTIKSVEGPTALTVPVRSKGRFGQKINEVEILAENNWRQKHWQSLVANYQRAAYFEKYADGLKDFFQQPWTSLVEVNLASSKWASEILQINRRWVRGSDLQTKARGSDRIIAWANAVHAGVYLCDAHEKQLLDLAKFEEAEIEVKSYDYAAPVYHQQFGAFASNLSILDLILNEGEESGRILMGRNIQAPAS